MGKGYFLRIEFHKDAKIEAVGKALVEFYHSGQIGVFDIHHLPGKIQEEFIKQKNRVEGV